MKEDLWEVSSTCDAEDALYKMEYWSLVLDFKGEKRIVIEDYDYEGIHNMALSLIEKSALDQKSELKSITLCQNGYRMRKWTKKETLLEN